MHLSVSRVSKNYDPVTVLRDVSFTVSMGERVGLVGANGSGKSTLLRILAGDVTADWGHVRLSANGEIGFLPQDPPDPGSASIDELIYQSAGELGVIEERLRSLEARMSESNEGDVEQVIEEYGLLLDQFEQRGGYDIDHRIDAVRHGLGIAHIPRERQFTALSGGEKSRVLLASLLLTSPDILLLDEPTNHLDFGAITWLQEYLAGFSGILIVISHDRHFLNQTVTRIIEIDEHSHLIRDYPGNYENFATVKQRERENWEKNYAAQQDEITELRRSIRVVRAGGERKPPPLSDGDKHIKEARQARADKTAGKGIRMLEERLRRIEENPVPRPPAMMRINPGLDAADLHSDEIVRFERVSLVLGQRKVLRDVSFTLRRGQQVVLVGPNGAGKSTILNLIAGRLVPDTGRVIVAPAARVGYLDQDGSGLERNRTVLDTYRDGLDGLEHELISDLFRHGLFTMDDLAKTVAELSTGQRRKLQLARLAAQEANFLLLDEPTNHLSLDVLEEFEAALERFEGPIMAASHDRFFIGRFGGAVWELLDGSVRQHHDDAEEVLARMVPMKNRTVA